MELGILEPGNSGAWEFWSLEFLEPEIIWRISRRGRIWSILMYLLKEYLQPPQLKVLEPENHLYDFSPRTDLAESPELEFMELELIWRISAEVQFGV